MAFQSGDVRGTKTAAEARHAHKARPFNMLERSQAVPNDETRATYDHMYKPTKCDDCGQWSDELGKCWRKQNNQPCNIEGDAA